MSWRHLNSSHFKPVCADATYLGINRSITRKIGIHILPDYIDVTDVGINMNSVPDGVSHCCLCQRPKLALSGSSNKVKPS